MADKKDTTEKKKKIKITAEKTTGTAADKIISLAGATREAPPRAKSMKKDKLLAKNKHRLPRRQKKAEQKAADHL